MAHLQSARHERMVKIPKILATGIVAHVGVNAVLWNLATGGDIAQFKQEYEEVIPIALPD